MVLTVYKAMSGTKAGVGRKEYCITSLKTELTESTKDKG